MVEYDLTYAGKCCEQNAPRLQDSIQRLECTLGVVNELQRLRKNHTVKNVRRYMGCTAQITDKSRVCIARRDIKHIRLNHTAIPEPPCVCVLADFQHTAADIVLVGGQKSLDVIPVDRQAAVETVIPADRCAPAKIAKSNATHRRPPFLKAPPAREVDLRRHLHCSGWDSSHRSGKYMWQVDDQVGGQTHKTSWIISNE